MAEVAEQAPILLGSILFIFGAIFGSFANVVIYRMPEGKSIVKPGSHCYSCNKPVAWHDNIPIVSWFLLRGKCRNCEAKFSPRYALVEFLMGALFCGLFFWHGWSWTLLEHCIFIFGLVTASFIDFDHMILPDEFTLSGIVIGLIGAALIPAREFMPALWGVLVGGGFLWAIAAIYMTLRKIEGMGGGDIKLLAWIGAVLGWQSIPFVVLSASVVGTLVGLYQMSKSKDGLQTAIPFGPYLALGAILFIFGGESLGEAYVRFFIPSLGTAN